MCKRQIMDERWKIEESRAEKAFAGREEHEEAKKEVSRLKKALGLTDDFLRSLLRKYGKDGLLQSLRSMEQRRKLLRIYEPEFALLRRAA